MIRLFALAALVAVGVAGGMYFGLRGSAEPVRPPSGQRNAILERALERGIVTGYRAVDISYGGSTYVTSDRKIQVQFFSGCPGSCPSNSRNAFVIEYQRGARVPAEAIERTAEARLPNTSIHIFETTTLGG